MFAGRLQLLVAVLVVALPRAAHATSMDGLAVVVAGIFVGVPVGLLLALSIVLSIVALNRAQPGGFHRAHARAMTVLAPLLGLLFPIGMLFFESRFVGVALFLDLPLLILALAAWLLARRVARRLSARGAPGPR